MSRYIGENAMENYEMLEIEVIEFDRVDVITNSDAKTSEICIYDQDSDN